MYAHDMIEFVLTYQDNVEKAIEEKRLDPNIPKTGGGNGHCRISDPTYMTAARNLTDLDYVIVPYGQYTRTVREPDKWMKVARAVRKWYAGKIQGKIIERRFKPVPDRRNDICAELGIGTSYYSSMLKDVFDFATAYAAGKGLIKI